MKRILLITLLFIVLLNGISYGQEGYLKGNSKFAEFISSNYMSILLLTVGFIGMILEIFIPGFGIGGIISIISFGLFFAGNMIAGNSEWPSLLVFIG